MSKSEWRKAGSSPDGTIGNCVELSEEQGIALLRESDRPDEVIRTTLSRGRAFLDGIGTAGEACLCFGNLGEFFVEWADSSVTVRLDGQQFVTSQENYGLFVKAVIEGEFADMWTGG